MEKETLSGLSYNELMELYDAIRKEIRRRTDLVTISHKEKPYGTDKLE